MCGKIFIVPVLISIYPTTYS